MLISGLNHTVPAPTKKPVKGSSLFFLGAILGAALLWGLNAGREFIPGWFRSIFVPPTLLRLVDLAFGWIPARFCAVVSPGTDAEFLAACARVITNGIYHVYANAFEYPLVAIYYGLIVLLLARGYSYSKARTEW